MKRISKSAIGFTATLLLAPALSWAGGTVNNCTEAELRAAMTGGGTVTFACDGTITLANTITNEANTLLDATGHLITISGGNAVRVFYIKTNISLTLVNLVIANGKSTSGAGVYNDGGTLNLSGVSLTANVVTNTWPAYPPYELIVSEGGAIYNAGVLSATRCTFSLNRADGRKGLNGNSSYPQSPKGGSPGDGAEGGAIYTVWSGAMYIDSSLFASNSATGGDGGNGAGGGEDRWCFYDHTGGDGGPAASGRCSLNWSRS